MGDIMKLGIAALAILAALAPAAARAQPASLSGASIPAQFHGRWAKNQAACKPEPDGQSANAARRLHQRRSCPTSA